MAEWDDRFRRADGLYAWDALANEGGTAYNAFCIYRDLGINRSIDAAFRAFKGSQAGGDPVAEKRGAPGRWSVWAAQHEWVSRARQYDAYLELRARREAEAQHMADLEQFRTRQLRVARALQEGGLRMVRVSNGFIEQMERAQAAGGVTMRASTVASLYRSAAAAIQASAAAEAQALAIDELLGLLKGLDADE